MEPKIKAKQIYNQMAIEWLQAKEPKQDFLKPQNPYVKQCALIAVEEIIETVKDLCDEENLTPNLIYWKRVKAEIEKI